ncbi:MAG: ATP-binding protein [Myxococcales bacterium]
MSQQRKIGGQGTERQRGKPVVEHDAVLVEKYDRLCDKYHALMEKFEDLQRHRIAVFQLGWWALRTSNSALALVRNGGIELNNNRWHDLARGDGTRAWEALGDDESGPAVHTTLHDLALHEAAEALAHPESPRLRRYGGRGNDRVLEIRTEVVDMDQRLVTLLVHDVTEQARAETELRKAQDVLLHRDRLQTIGEVASGVAHDLNNSLNVMRLRLELMRKAGGNAGGANLDALARIVDDAAMRVARMRDLAGKGSDDFQPVDLGEAIAEAVALARTNLEHSPAPGAPRFHLVSRTDGAASVLANPAELRHVFVNLLLNARDAMPAGGTITVDCSREKDCTAVRVADEGTGIPPEHLDRIFESFFTTKGSKGTGLGLSMARGAMSRIGGSIHASNRSPRGAEFLLRFPVGRVVGERAMPTSVARRTPIEGNMRVLVVDDDVDCLEVMRAVLEAEALVVDGAGSGADALGLLSRNSYDLLLCDIGMPEMSGWQVAGQARLDQPTLPIYMVTGWASEFAPTDSHRHAVDGVLGKPIDLEELREVLGRVATTRQRGGKDVQV